MSRRKFAKGTTLVDKFDALTEPADNGCLEWRGWKTKGYGQIDHEGKRYSAHRVACAMLHGPAPKGRNSACHKCHNPGCVNPFHLYWGSQADNAQDMLKAGRHVPGGRTGVTECINGHEYTPDNTYWEPSGMPCRPNTNGRGCKECRREAVRRFRARKAAERVA